MMRLLLPVLALVLAGCAADESAGGGTTTTTTGVATTTSATTTTTTPPPTTTTPPPTTTTPPPTTTTPPPTTTTPPEGAPAQASVAIQGFSFQPSTVRVATGGSVTWTNMDAAPHTATSQAGAPEPFDSGTLANGGTFTHTFATPGTYEYRCALHASMRGTVVVE